MSGQQGEQRSSFFGKRLRATRRESIEKPWLRHTTHVGNRNLQNLRKSIAWEEPSNQIRIEALQGRLEELLILELDIQDGRRFLGLSVRTLYKYVLSAITHPIMNPGEACPNESTEEYAEEDVPLCKKCPDPIREKLLRGSTRSNNDESLKETSYRERLGGYLHPRDMRRLVTPFSASNEPALIVRRHAMLLNFDPLRAIILRDRLLVIVPDGADSILGNVEAVLRGGYLSAAKDFLDEEPSQGLKNACRRYSLGVPCEKTGKRTSTVKKENSWPTSDHQRTEEQERERENEWTQMKGKEWVDLPFELQCVDSILHVVSTILQKDTYDLQKSALEYIQRLVHDDGVMKDDPLTVIRAVKDAVGELTSRVNGFVHSLNRILDEDEDMALMNLSRLLTCPERFIKPVSQAILEEESDEPELILEAHLQTGLTLMNSLNLITGQISTASEMVNQKLDTVRNKLLFVNILVSVLSLSLTSASLVGSMLGMNLKNHLEDAEDAFIHVTFVTIAGSLLFGALIMFVLVYSGTVPKISSSSRIISLDAM